VREMRRRCYNLTRTVRRLRQSLSERQERRSFRLVVVGMVRAGLSNPDSSARTVEEYCREALTTDLPQVGRTSVCHLRHAFARIWLNLCLEQARRYTAETARGFGCIQAPPRRSMHAHEEYHSERWRRLQQVAFQQSPEQQLHDSHRSQFRAALDYRVAGVGC